MTARPGRSPSTSVAAASERLLTQALPVATRAYKLALRGSLKAEGLTIPMFSALDELAHAGPMSMGEIAASCLVTPASFSEAVNTLVELGFAERQTSPKDRRVAMIAATTRGLKTRKRVWSLVAETLAGSLSGASVADLDAAARVLNGLAPPQRGAAPIPEMAA
jgi:DNA-binding MarR family transcriptional regulator